MNDYETIISVFPFIGTAVVTRRELAFHVDFVYVIAMDSISY